jgi:signal transduction histidine kinase
LSAELRRWLQERCEALAAATLDRAPNMLPDAVAVSQFLALLAEAEGHGAARQLAAVQGWALKEIGPDAAAANDWVTILRTMKEVVADALAAEFPIRKAWGHWRQLDHIFTYAITEASRLAGDVDRVSLLEHMVDLRREMERLNRSKSSFVAVAAHELKTPLTLLEGYAAMIRAEAPADRPQLALMLDGLNSGTRRLREIIGDMIDAAAIDSKAFAVHFQPVHLDKVIDNVAETLAAAFEERKVTLEVRPSLLKTPLFGDPDRLVQAFRNVLVNGLKYTPDGGRVTVSTIRTRPGEISETIAGFVDVQVADTGIGIDPGDLQEIFEKFSASRNIALHSSGKTKFKGGGPGLGLPIARGIIEAHGGRIWAESPGRDEAQLPGSVFHVELPIYVKQPETPPNGER